MKDQKEHTGSFWDGCFHVIVIYALIVVVIVLGIVINQIFFVQ